MIGIIDYGAGNAKNVAKALNYLGQKTTIVRSPKDFSNVRRIVFPGVGSFGYCMEQLRKRKLDDALILEIKKKPFLGICLGLQILFEESEESPGVRGLCVFKGKVVKFRQGKIPQIGWNEIIPKKRFPQGYAYFVNSYYAIPQDKEIIAAKSNYFVPFVSAISKNRLLGVQFHPEKSAEYGLSVLKEWLRC